MRAAGDPREKQPEYNHLRQDHGLLVMLIGTVLDPVNSIADAEAIVGDLHACLSKSDEAFFDRLDDLSGRFVVLVESGSRAFALQDATGTRTLFYDTGSDGLTVSSHASLIAEMAAERCARSIEYFRRP